MDEYQRGIIRAVKAEGGLLAMTLECPKTRRRYYVVGDNGPTVRALAEIFGSEVISGDSLLAPLLLGTEIGYHIDEYGVLDRLEP